MHLETLSDARRRPRKPRLIVLPLIAAAAIALTYLASRPLGSAPQPSFFVIGSAGPGVQIGQVAPGMAPAPASPELALTDLDGTPVTLGAFAGRPLWINFWKTACPPCEAEAADVAAAYAAHREEGLVLLAVDVWDTPTVVRDYLAGHPLPYPVVVESSTAVMEAYGVWGAPTHYFIGSDGVIRDRYFGPMTAGLIADALGTILRASAP